MFYDCKVKNLRNPLNLKNNEKKALQIRGNNIFYISFLADSDVCAVCKFELQGSHLCKKCKKFVHPFCGMTDVGDEEGYGKPVICDTCISLHFGKSNHS